MFKLRMAILVAGAALAFGSASVLAMTSNFDHSRHGSVVSSAARTTCRALASEARGNCVSAIASSEGQENRDGARAKAVHACQQSNGGEAGATHAQHKAIVACITGKKPSWGGMKGGPPWPALPFSGAGNRNRYHSASGASPAPGR